MTVLDVLEHVDDDEKSLRAISDILNPGGLLLVTVPAYGFLWTSHDQANQHKRRYEIGDLRQKLKKAGFKVEKISYFNTFLFPPIFIIKLFLLLFSKNSKAAHFWKNLPPRFFNKTLKLIFSSEKYFLSKINFPFGISIVAIASENRP